MLKIKGSRYGLTPFDMLRLAPYSTRAFTPNPSPKGRGVKKRGLSSERSERIETRSA